MIKVNSISKWLLVTFAMTISTLFIQVNAKQDKQTALPNETVRSSPIAKVWSPRTGFADLIEQVSPAVVHVAISGSIKRKQRPEFNFPPGSPFQDFFEQYNNQQKKRQQSPQKEEKRPLGLGSGFIISADGYVVTNHHVIKGADEIIVTLKDGQEYVAQLKGSDKKTDLALLKLKNAKNLPFVNWGDDNKSRVGDWVLAIGTPFGLGGSATTGIISARGRDINSGPYDDYIQVDAAINRGNSGGPLFNLSGEVIGINTAIYSPNGGSVGIGFSIPSNMAKNVITQIRDKGSVERAWIGVQIQPLSDELAEGFGRKNDEGALISSVVIGKPAYKAGLQAGDIVLSFAGNEIKEMRDLPKQVAQSKVGDTSNVVVWRNGSKKTLKIETERFPQEGAQIASVQKKIEAEMSENDKFGAKLLTLTGELKKKYKMADDVNGLLIMQVYEGGLAQNNGLRAGDVISGFNNSPVIEVGELLALLKSAKRQKKSKVVMLIQRKGDSRFLPFSLDES